MNPVRSSTISETGENLRGEAGFASGQPFVTVRERASNGMKILIVSTAYLPLIGGAELAIKEITDRIGSQSFELIAAKIHRRLLSREQIGRVKVRRIGLGTSFDKYFLPIAVAWRLSVRRYDLVWIVMASYGSFALPLVKLIRPRLRFLLTLQEGDSEEHILRRVGVFYPFWRWVFSSADHIQAISSYLADFARRHGARCLIEVVPNGVSLEKFDPPKGRTKSETNSRFAIIHAGRLVPKNGIDILIRAVAELKTYNLQLKTLIVGDGAERAKLEKLASELNVRDIVAFVGEVSHSDVPRYLSQADIFVRPSRSEGLGTAFLEAMAAGLPIIGTPVGGITDFLKPYNADDADSMPMMRIADANGLFVKLDNPHDLAVKIKLLLNNGDLRKGLGENGRELVYQQYNWDTIASRLARIFNQLNKKL